MSRYEIKDIITDRILGWAQSIQAADKLARLLSSLPKVGIYDNNNDAFVMEYSNGILVENRIQPKTVKPHTSFGPELVSKCAPETPPAPPEPSPSKRYIIRRKDSSNSI